MKKLLAPLAIGFLLLSTASRGDDQVKDEDRLKNCGTVLTEIMNIPDNIPQDVLDKADCVVVFPSVLKAAFIDGDVYAGDDQLKALTSLKSKHDLIGEIIGLLQSPAKNVISGLNAGNKLAGLIKALEARAEAAAN